MMAEFLRGRDRSEIPQQQLARMEERMQRQLAEGQRVPMIRITTHQPLPVVRVVPFNEYQRNRYYR
jgi:hypothetical protein